MAYKPATNYPLHDGITTSYDVQVFDQNFAYVSGKWLSVKDFGAVGDGVTDDYAAIVAAIAFAQSLGSGVVLYFPPGTYAFKTPIVIASTPVRLVGSGMATFAYAPVGATVGTTLKYTGVATSSPAITFSLVQAAGMAHFGLDCNSLADIGMDLDSCTFGIFDDIHITSSNVKSLLLTTAGGGQSTSWNTLRNFNIDLSSSTASAAIHLTGTANTNTCHNTFQDFHVNFGGSSNPDGIWLGDCDNNRLYNMMLFRTSGTGAGVRTKPAEAAGFPESNIFFHLQASNGGWVNDVSQANWNVIVGYDRVNGQPAPVTNNKPLLWMDMWGAWNTLIGGNAGASGGADVRTVLQVNSGTGASFAQIIAGFQGTSVNFYDADVHHFRDHAQGNDATIQSRVIAVNGVQFPAVQVASADPNNLDDYEEGTFTPGFTFATPGDLSTTGTFLGDYTKIGRDISVNLTLISSTFAWTTASGAASITGLPFTSFNAGNRFWGCAFSEVQGITKAGFTQFGIRVAANTTAASVFASGSAASATTVNAADMPSGGTYVFIVSFTYKTST